MDHWLEKLREKDILYDQAEGVGRLEKKSRIRKCILNGIDEMASRRSICAVGTELGLSNLPRIHSSAPK